MQTLTKCKNLFNCELPEEFDSSEESSDKFESELLDELDELELDEIESFESEAEFRTFL